MHLNKFLRKTNFTQFDKLYYLTTILTNFLGTTLSSSLSSSIGAVLVTIPFIKLINKNQIPLVTLISVVCNAVGLFLIYALVKDSNSVDTTSLFSAKNIPILLCVFLVGVGYVLITQACMIWVKSLFPEESKGQFEGLRVLFFTLIPMLIGTLIGNAIIKNTAQGNAQYDDYGHLIEVPQENLFLWAAIIVLFTFIPLIFASKAYYKRVKETKVEEAIADKA